jgi:hypothetical protein
MKLFYKITLASALLAVVMNPVYAAYNDADTDYSKLDSYSWYSKGPAAETMAMLEFLLCATSKSRIAENNGNKYSLLIDQNVCFNKSGEDGPNYGEMAIDATKQDTDLTTYHIDGWYTMADKRQALTTIDIFGSPTDLAPMGVFNMRWQVLDPDNLAAFTDLPRGELEFKADGTVSYYEYSNHASDLLVGYASGTVAPDLSSASLAFRSAAWNSSLTPPAYENRDYRYVYDKNNILWDELDSDAVSSNTVCSTRDSSAVVEHVIEYTLFNEDGSKVEAGLPFMFTYTDSGNGISQGYVSGWGTWLQNGETLALGNRPTQITKGDAKYTICYDDVDDGTTTCGTDPSLAADNVKVYLVGIDGASPIAFTSPMNFDPVSLTNRSSLIVENVNISYSGTVYVNPYTKICSNGLGGWQSSPCDTQADERPTYTIPDGTQLSVTGGTTKYRIKAARILKDFGVESLLTECAALNINTAPLQISDAAAKANIEATGLLWGDKPTDLTDENTLKYIDGVEQDK